MKSLGSIGALKSRWTRRRVSLLCVAAFSGWTAAELQATANPHSIRDLEIWRNYIEVSEDILKVNASSARHGFR